MAELAPVAPAGEWNSQVNSGATWGPTEITMIRDGVTIIPDSAVFTVHTNDGTLVLTLAATIDGGTGVMTVPALDDTETAALDWQYGNLLFKTTEGDGTVTDLLAGNITVRNYSD